MEGPLSPVIIIIIINYLKVKKVKENKREMKLKKENKKERKSQMWRLSFVVPVHRKFDGHQFVVSLSRYKAGPPLLKTTNKVEQM